MKISRPDVVLKKQDVLLTDIETLTAEGKIFSPENIRLDTLERLLKNSAILSYKEGAVLYEQGVPARTIDLFVIISAEFAVWHIYQDEKDETKQKKIQVGTDSAGNLAGDVELLLRTSLHTSKLAVKTRQLSGAQTWAKRICTKPGDVLCIDTGQFFGVNGNGDFVLRIDDIQFILAIARQLAVKLVQRTAAADPKSTTKRKEQVIEYLRDWLRDPARTGDNPKAVEITQNLQYFAEKVGCSRQTVSKAFQSLVDQKICTRHKYSLNLVVPRSFWIRELE